MIADALSLKFAALADPTRRAMLRRLARGDATLTDLAQPFDMTTPAVAKHLRVLERAGLVKRGARSQVRPITMRGDALSGMKNWIDRCTVHWKGSFDRLDQLLSEPETADE